MPRRNRRVGQATVGLRIPRRTAAQNRARGNFMVFMIFLTFFTVGTYYMILYMMTPYADRSPEPSETGHQASHACGDSNWSAGSTFFTVAALCFGYYAYPRGSLILARSGRSWRLSPVLAAEETILIAGLFVSAKIAYKHKTATICRVLLLFRFLNECDPAEVRQRLELTTKEPPTNQDAEIYRLVKEKREVDRLANISHIEPRSSVAQIAVAHNSNTRAQDPSNADQIHGDPDADLEMRRVAVPEAALTPAVAPSWGRPAEDKDVAAYFHGFELARRTVKDQHLRYNVHLVQGFTRYTQSLDTGPSYRIFVWTPMILQAIKLIYVLILSSHVSHLTYLLAGTYFFSWLAIELVMIGASSPKPSESEVETAAQMVYEWRPLLNLLSGADRMRERAIISCLEIPSVWSAAALNVVLTSKFAYDSGLPFIKEAWIAIPAMAGIYIATMIVLIICAFPIILLIPHLLWSMSGKMPWAKQWIGETHDKDKDLDWASLIPASVALQTAVIIIFAYAEVGPWSGTFPCWSMMKPPDWFG